MLSKSPAPKKSGPLRVGIIGLGVGEGHIAGFESHGGARVEVLCDLSAEKLAEAAGKYPDKRLTADADSILNDPSIDAVSIASFDNFHHQQVMTALRNGKHVFAEKPLCLSFEQLAEIRAAWKASAGLRLSSNLILRMSPRFRRLREKIQAGEMGLVYCVEAAYDYGRIHKIHRGWRGEIDLYSVTLGGGLHLVDLLLWLTGDRVSEVFAYGTRIASEGSQFRHNDTVVAVLKLKSGAVAKVCSNFACVHPHFHELNVFGTKSTFLNRPGPALWLETSDPKRPPAELDDAYPGVKKGDLIPSFLDSILTGAEPEIDEEEVFHAMEACLAIDESARRGVPVKVGTV